MYFCNLFILSLRSDLHVASHIYMNKLAIIGIIQSTLNT